MNSNQLSITAVSWVFGCIASGGVAMRLYTRGIVLRRAGWDDFFIALSLASALTCTALVQVAVNYGLGRHAGEITDPYRLMQAFKYTVIAPNFSVVSTTTGKISVTIFLLRLMGQSATLYRRWFLYILMIISVAMNVLCIIAIIGFCRPAERIWNPSVKGSCLSLKFQLVAGTSQASYNAFCDIALAVFPAFIFWRVQLPVKMRVAIVAVMGAGVLAGAATIVKCVLLKNVPAHADLTWSWAPITLWYSIEMYVIIICATLPTIRQSYMVVLNHPRKGSGYTYSHTHSRQKPIALKPRSMDASILGTRLEGPTGGNPSETSSQEHILESGGIHKTTEVHVVQEDPGQGHSDSLHRQPGSFRNHF